MSDATATKDAPGDVLAQLNRVSSAEEFFALLGVDYDPRVLNVMRLHILRRMGQYLVSDNFDGQSNAAVTERCKEVLARAYADFLASSPLDQRVFKVLRDAAAPPKAPVFVPLAMLK
jgi:nitrogenase-stabilizing/protective protein